MVSFQLIFCNDIQHLQVKIHRSDINGTIYIQIFERSPSIYDILNALWIAQRGNRGHLTPQYIYPTRVTQQDSALVQIDIQALIHGRDNQEDMYLHYKSLTRVNDVIIQGTLMIIMISAESTPSANVQESQKRVCSVRVRYPYLILLRLYKPWQRYRDFTL